MIRRWIRRLHLWTGLATCLLLLVFALTGAALVYKVAYWRLVYPELRGPVPAFAPDDVAAAVRAAEVTFGASLRTVKLPEPGIAAYHLYLEEGEAFVAPSSHAVIDRWRPAERVMGWVFDLHAHLLAGEAGERVGGAVGLLGAFLALSGMVLWWPARRRFSPRALVPRGLSRRELLVWHRHLGALASPILLVVLFSAGGLVFYDAAGSILGALFGGGDGAVVESPAPSPPTVSGPLTGALVERAHAAFPDARVVFYYPPAAASDVHRFRMRRPCELHPNGRTYVSVDAAGRVTAATDACAAGAGVRALHALYPFHSGKALGAVYKGVLLFGALALASLSVSGALSYGRRLFARTG